MELGYDTVVIFGNPENYISSGFKNGKRYSVSTGNDNYPVALLVKELKDGVLNGRKWIYKESPACDVESSEAEEFDKEFEHMEKGCLVKINKKILNEDKFQFVIALYE